MSVWQQTYGTWVNVATVLIGSLLGLALRGRLPERIVQVVMQAIGLTVLFIGVHSAWDLTRVVEPPGVIVALVGLALGGAFGEALRLEERLEALGGRLKRHFRGRGPFTEGFVAASLLFCVGPLTLIGAVQNGLAGDAEFLMLKSALDGISSLALATSFGLGVMFSTIVIAVYQGGLSLAAGSFAALVPDPGNDPHVLLVNGVGGLMILGLGLGLLEIRRVRVASLLPALPLVLPLYWLGRALL